MVESPGLDPCSELETRAGLWRFSSKEPRQTQRDGKRVVKGVRNATAIAFDPETKEVWLAVNGRDQLHENWPDIFTPAKDVVLPAEEIRKVGDGDDHGWPYGYYDRDTKRMTLAPEYGGDGMVVGRCDDVGGRQAGQARGVRGFFRGRSASAT